MFRFKDHELMGIWCLFTGNLLDFDFLEVCLQVFDILSVFGCGD